jgi:hypothetical protein
MLFGAGELRELLEQLAAAQGIVASVDLAVLEAVPFDELRAVFAGMLQPLGQGPRPRAKPRRP